jgi:hypothetical protein
VGGRADTGVAFSLQASLRTLRAAGRHPRSFLSSMLRTHLPQLSPTCVLKRALNEGRIRDVDLRLRDFSHTYPSDVGVLLVGPQGQNAVVMRSVGGSKDVSGTNLTLDDEATDRLPLSSQITSGTFRPTVGEYWRTPSPLRPQRVPTARRSLSSMAPTPTAPGSFTS